MSFAVVESQRDSSLQPRVGEPASLPWVPCRYSSQPQRGCVSLRTPNRLNPDGVEYHFELLTQGSRSSPVRLGPPTLGWMTLPRWGNQLVEAHV